MVLMSQVDHWMCERKWWWALWFWGIQVLLVNLYLLYKTAYLHVWKKDPKTITLQYDFRYQIVLAWFGVLVSRTNADETKHGFDEQTTSTQHTTPSSKKAKHVKVKDTTLDPVPGSLRVRLNSDYHYSEPSQAKDPVYKRWRPF
jgi:hypothetical protein